MRLRRLQSYMFIQSRDGHVAAFFVELRDCRSKKDRMLIKVFANVKVGEKA